MANKRNPHATGQSGPRRRERAAALRAYGHTFAEVGRRLGVSRQAAWIMVAKHKASHNAGVRCARCRAVVTTRHLQQRTLGKVLCARCLAARPGVPFALRLQSHRVAAGLTRTGLEAAAGLAPGRVKEFEERGVKPHQSARLRLARVLAAPDLARFDDEGDAG
jgi:hypothetical protein